jgi:O-antigen ligase
MKYFYKPGMSPDRLKKTIEWGLVLTVAGTTLAFGGVVPLAYSLMEVSVFALLLVLVIFQTREGSIDLPVPIALVPIVLFVLLQLVPLPAALIHWISPSRTRIFATSGLLSAPDWISLSVYPRQTFESLLKLLAYCTALVLAAYVFESKTRKSVLIRALILLGAFEAAYGIIQYLTGFQRIFTFVKQYYTEEATGTFINHNHFAGFLELTAPLLIVQIFYLVQKLSPQGPTRRSRGTSWSNLPVSQIVVLIIAAVLLLMGVFYSRSRVGILSIISSFVFIGLLGQLRMRGRKWMLVTMFILAFAVSYAVWIGVGPVLGRYEQLREARYLESEGRLLLWRDGLRIVNDFPAVGTGLGTFSTIYRRYQTGLVQLFVDHIHSDYLEFLSELGIIGSVFLFGPMLLLWLKIVRVFTVERSRYRRSVLLGCAGSMVAIFIHTATDFNLQIPANAIVLAIIMGIGYKLAWVEVRAMEALAGSNRTSAGRNSNDELAQALKVRPA